MHWKKGKRRIYYTNQTPHSTDQNTRRNNFQGAMYIASTKAKNWQNHYCNSANHSPDPIDLQS